MRLSKKYFGNSVRLAMGQACRELGPDTALVSSRPTGPEARHLGEYEMVFSLELTEASSAGPRDKESRQTWAAKAAILEPEAEVETGLTEVYSARRQSSSANRTGISPEVQPHRIRDSSQLDDLYSILIQSEVQQELAQKFIAGVQGRLRDPDRHTVPASTTSLPQSFKAEFRRQQEAMDWEAARATLAAEIEGSIRVDAELGQPGNACRVAALIGPPGVGKTTTIAKLAMRYGLVEKKRTMLISLGDQRLAASEPLRSYASILGIRFQDVETQNELSRVLTDNREMQLVLIDTPGLSMHDLDSGWDAAGFLAEQSGIQKHLVLPASMRSTDLARVSSAYSVFRPTRLICTRMDETETFGPMLSESVNSSRPISFLTTGQRVPQDLVPADGKSLTERLLGLSGRCSLRLVGAA